MQRKSSVFFFKFLFLSSFSNTGKPSNQSKKNNPLSSNKSACSETACNKYSASDLLSQWWPEISWEWNNLPLWIPFFTHMLQHDHWIHVKMDLLLKKKKATQPWRQPLLFREQLGLMKMQAFLSLSFFFFCQHLTAQITDFACWIYMSSLECCCCTKTAAETTTQGAAGVCVHL